SNLKTNNESYPGQNILISYIKERKGKSSYRGFLNLHRDVIVFIISSSLSKDWRDLDTSWARRFLEEAKELLNQTIFLALKEKVCFFYFAKEGQLLVGSHPESGELLGLFAL
ncbi:6338_t:CDS:2, partial [Funneliformis geosporum]